MVHTVKVTDRSPKAIVRELLHTGKGPRDTDGMNAVLDEWLNGNPTGNFLNYCRRQSWTLGQVLSLLDYQCCYIFVADEDDWMDAEEFEQMWHIFQPIIKKQGLLDVEKAVAELTIPLPDAQTRAAALEV
jgi:hypothetical protein